MSSKEESAGSKWIPSARRSVVMSVHCEAEVLRMAVSSPIPLNTSRPGPATCARRSRISPNSLLTRLVRRDRRGGMLNGEHRRGRRNVKASLWSCDRPPGQGSSSRFFGGILQGCRTRFPGCRSSQGSLDHIVDGIHEDQVDAFEQMFGNFLKILLIPFRQNHAGELGAFRGEDFFLQAADR